tara:strand:- start:505 stop:678 length:174 start_codon:yes stop_codon:yes gene_type:complete
MVILLTPEGTVQRQQQPGVHAFGLPQNHLTFQVFNPTVPTLSAVTDPAGKEAPDTFL